MRRNITLDKAV